MIQLFLILACVNVIIGVLTLTKTNLISALCILLVACGVEWGIIVLLHR